VNTLATLLGLWKESMEVTGPKPQLHWSHGERGLLVLKKVIALDIDDRGWVMLSMNGRSCCLGKLRSKVCTLSGQGRVKGFTSRFKCRKPQLCGSPAALPWAASGANWV
jgi:hypothetical protein